MDSSSHNCNSTTRFVPYSSVITLGDAEKTLSSGLMWRGSTTWAVVIGIDYYECECELPLKGAVKDACAFQEYLLDRLRVPRGQIVLLLNHAATRQGILDALYCHLRHNEKIRPGDTIIIYYAGHGTTYSSPYPDVEAILPADRGLYGSDTHLPVPDVSDREIQLFLSQLRDAKGDDITFIMDCSFSPGNLHDMRARIRYAPPLEDAQALQTAAERDPRKLWADGSAMTKGWRPDMSSHVVLSACSDDDDSPDGGPFTNALLRALREGPLHKMTYYDLKRSICHYYHKVPVVAGKNADSLVFQIGCLVRVTPRLSTSGQAGWASQRNIPGMNRVYG